MPTTEQPRRAGADETAPKSSPSVIIIAGPNGAGKSTAAKNVLLEALGVSHFVNADDIARGLSAFDPESVSIRAGRLMIKRLHYLASKRQDFAFETTLAPRSLAPWLRRWTKTEEYHARLVFVWLRSEELAVERVAARVRMGGHHVPPDTVRRRYHGGLKNFFQLYGPLMSGWQFFDNSKGSPSLIACREGKQEPYVARPDIWNRLEARYGKQGR